LFSLLNLYLRFDCHFQPLPDIGQKLASVFDLIKILSPNPVGQGFQVLAHAA